MNLWLTDCLFSAAGPWVNVVLVHYLRGVVVVGTQRFGVNGMSSPRCA